MTALAGAAIAARYIHSPTPPWFMGFVVLIGIALIGLIALIIVDEWKEWKERHRD
jgi:hypothetical protein